MSSSSKIPSTIQSSAEQQYRSRAKSSAEDRSAEQPYRSRAKSSAEDRNAEQPYRSRAKSSTEDRNRSLLYCPDIERVEQTRFPSYSTKSVEIFSESPSILLDSAGDISNNTALRRGVSQDSAPLNLQNIKEIKPKYSSRALFIKKPAVSHINVHLSVRVYVCAFVYVRMSMFICAYILMLICMHTCTCTVHP